MRKPLIALVLAFVLLQGTFVFAVKGEPEKSPWHAIFELQQQVELLWDAIEDLQDQINSIQLIPGPPGEPGAPGEPGSPGEPGAAASCEFKLMELVHIEILNAGSQEFELYCDAGWEAVNLQVKDRELKYLDNSSNLRWISGQDAENSSKWNYLVYATWTGGGWVNEDVQLQCFKCS